MSFGSSEQMIYILLIGVFCIFLSVCYFILRIYAVKRFFSRMVNLRRYYIHLALHFILIISIIAAFAFLLLRPRWGSHLQEVKSRDADLIVVLDVSRSMLVKEGDSSRLDRAKQAAIFAVNNFNGRAGLVLFAGDAFMQSPLTSDKGAFMLFLDAASADSISLQGTNILAAISEAARIFDKKSITKRVVLLITDGEEHEASVQSIIALAKKNKIAIHTAAIGSDSGQPVPFDSASDSAYLEFKSGEVVKSASNRPLLKSLAAATSGTFIDLDKSFAGLRNLRGEQGTKDNESLTSRYIEVPDEKYYVFAAILILLLLAELVFTSRRVRL